MSGVEHLRILKALVFINQQWTVALGGVKWFCNFTLPTSGFQRWSFFSAQLCAANHNYAGFLLVQVSSFSGFLRRSRGGSSNNLWQEHIWNLSQSAGNSCILLRKPHFSPRQGRPLWSSGDSDLWERGCPEPQEDLTQAGPGQDPLSPGEYLVPPIWMDWLF